MKIWVFFWLSLHETQKEEHVLLKIITCMPIRENQVCEYLPEYSLRALLLSDVIYLGTNRTSYIYLKDDYSNDINERQQLFIIIILYIFELFFLPAFIICPFHSYHAP